MRKTLKTTTAVLACLNLAVPYQAMAQDGSATQGASEICANNPAAPECRDAVEQGLADEEQQDEAEEPSGDQADPSSEADQNADVDASEDPSGGVDAASEAQSAESAPETEAPAEAPASDAPAAQDETEVAPEADQDGAAGAPAAPDAEDAGGAGAQDAPTAGDGEDGGAVATSPDATGSDATGSDAADDSAPSDGVGQDAAGPSTADPADATEEAGDGEDAEAETGSDAGAAPDGSGSGAGSEADTATDGADSQTESGAGIGGGDQGTADISTDVDSDPQTEADADAESRTRDQGGQGADVDTDSGSAAPRARQGQGGTQDATGTEDAGQSTQSDDGQTATGSGGAGQPATQDGDDSERNVDGAGTADQETGTEGNAATPTDAPAAGDNATGQSGASTTAADPSGSGGATGEQASGDGSVAAAAAGEDAEPEDVTTETVTEETARSSSEDFASGIDQSPEATEDSDDDGGLSNLEKALLVGAGALAVGAIMRNGREVVASSDDRVVVSGSDGGYELIKDDNALLRQPGAEVQTETFDDGSTRTIVNRADGSRIVTIRDAELRVVRRVRVLPDGQQVVLIDDTDAAQPVDTATLRPAQNRTMTFSQSMDEEALRQALADDQEFNRAYSLNQVRSIEQVRSQVPAIDLETITFQTGSAAISPEQADELTQLGQYIAARIEENPREIFLVEGHTDAVGDAAYNLALSDRRAESVALALTEYFSVPPENLVVQGYGEQFLKVQSEGAEQANRRASLRRITPLLQVAASQ